MKTKIRITISTPFETVNQILQEKQPHLTLLEFNGSNEIAKFHDSEYGEFEGRFKFVINGKALHKERSKKIRKEIANLQSTKEARVKTLKDQFGVQNVSQIKEVQEKRNSTFEKKYGGHPSQNKDVQDKRNQTFLDKFGSHPFANDKVKLKIKSKFDEKFGGNPQYDESVKIKTEQTRIEKGLTKTILGVSIKDFIKDKKLNISKTHLRKILRENGESACSEYKKNQTSIENRIAYYLDSLNIEYKFDKMLNGRRYDFLIEEHKFIIECDGLYWHSDLIIDDKNHSKNKLQHYKSNEYGCLFFRQDEIVDKYEIVKSMISNKLNLNTNKISARKCKIVEISTQESNNFFEANHLMGKGSGKTFALSLDDKLVCAMSIINKKDYIEISRFSSILNSTVIGGFSKLLNHVKKYIPNKKIISFVDARYGNGNSLIKNGFKKVSNHISFKWTDFDKTYHRMRFKNNTGYEKGLYKIWDCGQIKFETNS